MIKIIVNLCVLTFCLMDVELFRFDYSYYQEAGGWLKLHPMPANWTDARLQCYRDGAVLASPENESLLSAMRTVITNSQMEKRGFFTGIHATYSASKGDYYSIKGTPLSQMAIVWAPGEPDNAYNSEECLLMLPNGTLADVNCSDVYPYLCYRKQNNNATATHCGKVDSGYALDNRTGKCYKFHAERMDWAHAFAACAREGAHLAIINSATEAEVLKELCDVHYPTGNVTGVVASIGHREWEEHGLWMTIHGENLKEAGYDTWKSGEPNHVIGTGCERTRCGAMYKNTGQLDDVWCDEKNPFICEKEASIRDVLF